MDHEKWLEQHDQMMADHEVMMARHDAAMARHQEAIARHDIEMAELRVNQAKTENILRRAVRLGVQDARRQRKRNQEFDEQMTQINRALKAFLERGGNGKP